MRFNEDEKRNFAKTIGKRLEMVRRQMALTQKEVTQKMKMSQGYLSKLEGGEQRLINLILLAELAAFYDKPLAYFIPRPLLKLHEDF